METNYEPLGITRYTSNLRKTNYELTEEEEKEYLRKIKAGNLKAREEFICANLKLVLKYAKTKKGLPLADLIQYGNMGLIHAVDKFDLNANVKFSTYAVYWINSYMERGIENDSKIIRYPSNIYQFRYKYVKGYEILKEQLGREPTVDELAKYFRKKSETIEAYQKMNEPLSSFEEEMEKNPEKMESDYLVSDASKDFYLKEFYSDLEKALEESPFSKETQQLFWDVFYEEDIKKVSKKYGLGSRQIRLGMDEIYAYLRSDQRITSYFESYILGKKRV